MDLQDYRKSIDLIDHEIVALMVKRMKLSALIGEYKQKAGLPIYMPEREQEKLRQVSVQAGQSFAQYISALYEKIFELSRSYQEKHLDL